MASDPQRTLPPGVHTYSRRVEEVAALLARGERTSADLVEAILDDAALISEAVARKVEAARG